MKTLLGVAGGALALAGAAEGAARALSPRLPEERIWHDGVAQVKARQIRERRARRATGGVVFAGSSQMLDAVHPPTTAPELGRRAYNAALHRGFLPLTERWLLEEVLPKLRPRLVVLGLSILDMNDNNRAQHEQLGRYLASTAQRGTLKSKLRRGLHTQSAFVRHALARGPKVTLRTERVGPDGEGTEFLHATEYRLSDKKRNYIVEELLADYSTGDETLDRIDRVICGVRATGAEMVVVEMPVTDEIVELCPHGRADLDGVKAALRQEAARHDVRLVTEVGELTDRRWFADCVHVHGRGMAHVSRTLRAALTDELRALA